MKLIKTNEKIAVENYPYGYTLKTTLFNEVEFNPKKGYRTVHTTINPKNGKLNKPKKSTYSELIVRFYNEDGHIKNIHLSFNGKESINKSMKFINENFELFTKEEIQYFYGSVLYMIKVDIQSMIVYCNSKLEDLKPLYDSVIKNMAKGFKDSSLNLFNELLNTEEIEKTKEENYQPFKVTSYSIG